MHLLLLQLFLVRFHHKYFASALSPFFSSSLQCFNPIIASFIKNTMIYITLLGDIMRLGMQVLLCLNKWRFFQATVHFILQLTLLSSTFAYFISQKFPCISTAILNSVYHNRAPLPKSRIKSKKCTFILFVV